MAPTTNEQATSPSFPDHFSPLSSAGPSSEGLYSDSGNKVDRPHQTTMAVQTSEPNINDSKALLDEKGGLSLAAISNAQGKQKLITNYLARLNQIQSKLTQRSQQTQHLIDSAAMPSGSLVNMRTEDLTYENLFPFDQVYSSTPMHPLSTKGAFYEVKPKIEDQRYLTPLRGSTH